MSSKTYLLDREDSTSPEFYPQFASPKHPDPNFEPSMTDPFEEESRLKEEYKVYEDLMSQRFEKEGSKDVESAILPEFHPPTTDLDLDLHPSMIDPLDVESRLKEEYQLYEDLISHRLGFQNGIPALSIASEMDKVIKSPSKQERSRKRKLQNRNSYEMTNVYDDYFDDILREL